MKNRSERIVASALLCILLLAFFGGWIYVRFFAEEFVAARIVNPKKEIFTFVRENEDLLFEVLELKKKDYRSQRLTQIADTTILDDLNWKGDGQYMEECTDFCKGLSISGSCHKIVYYKDNPCQKIERGEWFPFENGLKIEQPGYSYYLEEIRNGFYYLHYIT